MTVITALFPIRQRFRPGNRTRLALVACLVSLTVACAPQEETFNARLSPFPVIGASAGGIGQATATLSGTTLAVTGSFEGLTYRAGRGGEVTATSAASARLHSSPITAMAGSSFADLTVEVQGDGGTIAGSVELTAAQIEMLRNGQVYAQVGTEDAPDGHLWGWFLQ